MNVAIFECICIYRMDSFWYCVDVKIIRPIECSPVGGIQTISFEFKHFVSNSGPYFAKVVIFIIIIHITAKSGIFA